MIRYLADIRSRRRAARATAIIVAMLLAVGLALVDTAAGQMFGQRNLGAETIGRRTRPGAASNDASGMLGNPNLDPGATMSTGLMNPGARFIRGNRGAQDFVGRDLMEAMTFIGNGGAITAAALRSAVNELRPPVEPDINRETTARSSRSNAMYPARLHVDFAVTWPETTTLSQSVRRQMERSLSLPSGRSLEVSVTGRQATLRGEVASAHERNLAAALASLEPGIDSVQNDLVVIEERDSGPPGPAENAPPSANNSPSWAEPPPLPSESRAPGNSAPVVRPVAP